jgi:hypothetical protein
MSHRNILVGALCPLCNECHVPRALMTRSRVRALSSRPRPLTAGGKAVATLTPLAAPLSGAMTVSRSYQRPIMRR